MQIIFEFQTEFGTFRDALHFPDEQPLPPEAEIEAMKVQRRDNWLAFIKAASEAPPIAPESEVIEESPQE